MVGRVEYENGSVGRKGFTRVRFVHACHRYALVPALGMSCWFRIVCRYI